jgi:hypothetical protein
MRISGGGLLRPLVRAEELGVEGLEESTGERTVQVPWPAARDTLGSLGAEGLAGAQ